MRENLRGYTPFTYLLHFKPTGQLYYGVRWAKKANPVDLWVTYFSSSKIIKALIREHGAESFDFQIRKTGSAASMRKLEERVHRHFNVAKSEKWLNATNAGSLCFYNPGRIKSQQERANLSAALTGRKLSPEHIRNSAEARRGYKQKPETIARRVAKITGRVWTDEQKKKMGDGQKGLKMYANIATYKINRFREAPEETGWYPWNSKWGLPKEMRSEYPRELFTGKPLEHKEKTPRKKISYKKYDNYIRTEEHKEKLRAALIGRKQTAEHITRSAEARKGFKQTVEQITNRAEKNRGKIRSTKQKENLKSGQYLFANLMTLEIKCFSLDTTPPHPWVRWHTCYGVPKEYREAYPKNIFQKV